MAEIAIIGDGPGGLSAALFLAKNGHRVTVFGDDATAMHSAHLKNYLGAPDTGGSDFQETAREQVEAVGATIVDTRVTAVTDADDGFHLSTEDGATVTADYLVLSEGRTPALAVDMGLDLDDRGAVVVDREQRTSRPRVYAVGRSTRPARSQAIISAGDGAVAALDILAAEAGTDVKDWDTP